MKYISQSIIREKMKNSVVIQFVLTKLSNTNSFDIKIAYAKPFFIELCLWQINVLQIWTQFQTWIMQIIF